jgi:hypothetical protein
MACDTGIIVYLRNLTRNILCVAFVGPTVPGSEFHAERFKALERNVKRGAVKKFQASFGAS